MRLWVWQCVESDLPEASSSFTISGEFAAPSQAAAVIDLVAGGVRRSDAVRFVTLYLDIDNRTRTLYCDYITEVRDAVEVARDPAGREARLRTLFETYRERFDALSRSVDAAVREQIRHVRLSSA